MKHTIRITLVAAIALLTTALPARATLLLDVGGVADRPLTFDPDQAVAVSFRLDSAISNVSISTPLICGTCSFTAYLMQANLGPTASVADLVNAANFAGVPLGGTLFSELSLMADDYYVVIENTGQQSIIWEGGDNPVVSMLAGVHHLDDWASTVFDPTFSPNSVFDVVLEQGARFYSINSTTVRSVPEPDSMALIILGASLIPFVKRRKKSRMLS
jgi:hypothetical protein